MAEAERRKQPFDPSQKEYTVKAIMLWIERKMER